MNVREATFDLMRELGLTTVFGNPGSTEETFLKDYPSDFRYVLALQEASALAIADGWAQATGKVAFVNLHTGPGLGNALGNLINTSMSKTPMILTTGQQTRTMALMEPWLTNVDAATFPRPHVKWSYEPVRAQDAPGALMRAYAHAVQPPAGPAYLSLPLDDWEKEALGAPVVRRVAARTGPDPAAIEAFADALNGSARPALLIGADVDRAGAWDLGVQLAERLQAAVYAPPSSERTSFPEDHPLYQGALPFSIPRLADKLKGHDVVLVIGAPVFRYYPYEPGDYLPKGARLMQISDDPSETARAPVGDALVADAGLALEALLARVQTGDRTAPTAMAAQPVSDMGQPLSPDALFSALAKALPEDFVLVEESPSNLAALHRQVKVTRPGSFFTMASGGLGFGLPGCVGVALGERDIGRGRRVVAVIGDGSFHYSVQSLATAAHHKLPMTVLVPVNREYAILKAFAEEEKTPKVPGLDLPWLDPVAVATGYGCRAMTAETADDVVDALRASFTHDGPTVIAAPIDVAVPPLFS